MATDIKIPTFTGNYFLSWTFAMEAALRAGQCWSAVTGIKPETTADERVKARYTESERNEKAYSLIVTSLGDRFAAFVRGEQSAKAALSTRNLWRH